MKSVDVAGNRGYTRHILGNAMDQMKLVPQKDWPLVGQLMNRAMSATGSSPRLRIASRMLAKTMKTAREMATLMAAFTRDMGFRVPRVVGVVGYSRVRCGTVA